jgi:hypothetical protein
MKHIPSKSVVIIGLLFMCSCGEKKKDSGEKEKQKDKLSDIILVDSIPFKNHKNIFWFKLRDILGNSSVSYIGLYPSACQIDTSNILIKGDLLYEIKLIEPSKLQITSHYGFDTVKPTTEITFVNKHFEYGQDFKRNSLKDEMSIDSICK